MSVTLKAMRYFITAIRNGNIARAAEDLNVAPSAVAAAIDRIEAQFGLTLVTRQRSRGISATASGHAIARKFERLLDDYHAVMAEGADLKQALSGTLRLGYYAPIAPAFLPKILSSALPIGKDVRFHLVACDNDAAQTGLLAGEFDAALFVAEGARPAVEFDVLVSAPAYCLLPKGHALAGRPSLSLRQIAEEPLVALNRPFASDYYRRLFDMQGVAPVIAAHATSTEMVRSLVGAGCGCAVLNMLPMTDVSYAGDALAAVPITDDLPPLTLAVGYTKSGARRLVTRFVDACRDHFSRPGPGRCIVGG